MQKQVWLINEQLYISPLWLAFMYGDNNGLGVIVCRKVSRVVYRVVQQMAHLHVIYKTIPVLLQHYTFRYCSSSSFSSRYTNAATTLCQG